MTIKNTGGPAFPLIIEEDGCITQVHKGMTLRDWFAGHAPEMPEQWWEDTLHDLGGRAHYAEAIASWRYFYADAMIAERSK